MKEQIRQKLISSQGRAEQSKITSTTKWWSRCLSAVIAKTASRNVVFKVSRVGASLLAAQSVVLTCEAPELSASLDDEEDLDDLGYDNADLFIFNQDNALD